MRLLVLLLSTFLIQSSAFAADDDERPRLDWRPSPAPRAHAGANPVAMTSAGATMLATAIASLGTGAYFMTRDFGVCGLDGNDCTPAQGAAVDRHLEIGTATTLLGIATLAASIPLLIAGADKVREQRDAKSDAKSKKPLLVPYVAPASGGAMTGLTVQF